MKRTLHLRVPVTPSEKARIQWGARSTNLSIASYLRHLGTGRPPRAAEDRARIQQLLSMNGNLGRFGGLLKLWLTNASKLDLFSRINVLALLQELQDTQHTLEQLVQHAMRSLNTSSSPTGVAFTPELNPPRRKHTLRVPVLQAEANLLRENASVQNLPVAAYLRHLGLSYRPLCNVDEAILHELQKSSEALARLGGFLKRWLADDPALSRYPTERITQAVHNTVQRSRSHLRDIQSIATRTP